MVVAELHCAGSHRNGQKHARSGCRNPLRSSSKAKSFFFRHSAVTHFFFETVLDCSQFLLCFYLFALNYLGYLKPASKIDCDVKKSWRLTHRLQMFCGNSAICVSTYMQLRIVSAAPWLQPIACCVRKSAVLGLARMWGHFARKERERY